MYWSFFCASPEWHCKRILRYVVQPTWEVSLQWSHMGLTTWPLCVCYEDWVTEEPLTVVPCGSHYEQWSKYGRGWTFKLLISAFPHSNVRKGMCRWDIVLSTTVREDDVSVIVLLRWISLGLLVFKRQNSSYSNGVKCTSITGAFYTFWHVIFHDRDYLSFPWWLRVITGSVSYCTVL